jgi:hypothetical protein
VLGFVWLFCSLFVWFVSFCVWGGVGGVLFLILGCIYVFWWGRFVGLLYSSHFLFA